MVKKAVDQKQHPYLKPKKNVVLLVQLGTPERPTYTSIMRFLNAFLRDRFVIALSPLIWWPILYGFILPFRPWFLRKKYAEIWSEKDGMPIHACSKHLASELNKDAPKTIHYAIAMRYGVHNIQHVLQDLKQDGVDRLVVLPLFPQYSRTTTASVIVACTKQLAQWPYMPELHCIRGYWDHPLYIKILADQVRAFWAKHGRSDRFLLAFHGLPSSSLPKGDPYYCLCSKTTRLLREALALEEHEITMVFQSRFGYQAWLQPYCDETLKTLALSGVTSVDIFSPGFAMDCLETLEELQVAYRDLFLAHGGQQYRYIPALNSGEEAVSLYRTLTESFCA